DGLARGERPPDTALPERWILSRLERTAAEVREALDAYRFNDAAVRLYQFTWNELCDWYLEAAKIPLGEGGPAADRTRGVQLYVPLAGVVDDVGGELGRLERELAKVEGELGATAAKLRNPQFIEKAPEDVVEEVRAKGVQLEERRAALGRSLERLRAMEA